MSKADIYPVRPVRRSQVIAALALTTGLVACGSSGSGQGSAGSAPAASATASSMITGPTLGAVFSGLIYVNNGITNQTKTFVYRDAAAQNCAAAVQGRHGTFKIPTGAAPAPQAAIEVTGFHGPGTYTPTMLSHDKQDSILLTGKSGVSQYVITSPVADRTAGKEVLFLKADGSGVLVYSGAHLNGQVGNPAVAGEVRWSCKS